MFKKNFDAKLLFTDTDSLTYEGVSIATEFDKFKDVLFNEKIIRHRMKRNIFNIYKYKSNIFIKFFS